MNIKILENTKEILDKEMSDSMKEKIGTWEYHQLALVNGELRYLIEILNNPNRLKRANHNHKLILQGKL